ncbi:MAG TPA: hypothetical protein VFC03_15350 [Acidimicrobiales bacterium]|nr:hypothetical protein [Acidimicrobiales bacterium]
MEAARAKLAQWDGDLIVPCPERSDALMACLGVDLDTPDGLILRSQMRRAHVRNHRLAA